MLDINETTLVQVTNNGPAPLSYLYASRPYLIYPGKTIGVPYYAACLWFGNPAAVDSTNPDSPTYKARTLEVDRMSTLYGLLGAVWTSPTPYTWTDSLDDRLSYEYVERPDGAYWHPNLPNVRVTDLESNVLPVVVMDPTGDSVTPADASTRSEQRATQEAISSMQAQLRSLQLQLARDQASTGEFKITTASTNTNEPTITPTITPESHPAPTAGRPSIDAPRRPGRPRKTPA